MTEKKDFNEAMEDMDKIEAGPVAETLMNELYEIYKSEVEAEKDII